MKFSLRNTFYFYFLNVDIQCPLPNSINGMENTATPEVKISPTRVTHGRSS